MCYKKIDFWIVAVLCLYSFSGYAQPTIKNNNSANINVEMGLPGREVNAIVKDSLGFIWFGTDNGLGCYDGHRFINFYNQNEDPNSLPNNGVLSLFVDSKGMLWVGTRKGIAIFDNKTGKFLRIKSSVNLAILSFAEDNNNTVWIGTLNGIYSIPDKPLSPDVSVQLKFNKPTQSLLYDDVHGLLAGTVNNGLHVKSPDSKSFKPYPLTGPDDFIFDVSASAMAGVFWLAVYGKGIARLNLESNKYELFSTDITSKVEKHNQFFKHVIEDDDGNVWAGADNLGLFQLKESQLTSVNFEEPGGAYKGFINTIYEDMPGRVWVGTRHNGAYLLQSRMSDIKSVKFSTKEKTYSKGSEVFSVTAFNDAVVFIGVKNGYIYKYNPVTDDIELFVQREGSPIQMSYSDNRLWVKHYNTDIAIYDNKGMPDTQLMKRITRLAENENIYNFQMINDTTIYLLYKTKIRKISKSQQNPIDFKSETVIGINDSLLKLGSRMFVYNKHPDFIFYTDDLNRLFLHDMANRTPIPLPKDMGFHYSKNISFFPRGDSLYISASDGLFLFDYKELSVRKIDIKQNDLNAGFTSLHGTEDGALWLSTRDRIIKLTSTYNVEKIFSVDEGIDNDFIGNASSLTPNGSLIAGGYNGISVINTNETESDIVQDVSVSGIEINKNRYNISNPSIDDTWLFKKDNFTIPAKTGRIIIRLSYKTFLPGVRYRYRNQTMNTEWTYLDNANEIIFTHLPSGQHPLEIQAIDNYHNWSPSKKVLLEVEYPWHFQWWMFIIYVSAIGFAFLIYRKWLIRIQQKNQERKLAILKNQQEIDLIKKDNELYMLKLKFFTNISHEFKTPLTLILTPLEKMLSGMQDSRTRETLQIVYQNAQRLYRLITQLMDYRKIDTGTFVLQYKKGRLDRFINKNLISFSAAFDSGGIMLKTDLEEVFAYFDDDKLEKVLYNLISNAVKFTPRGGEIEVVLRKINASEYQSDNDGLFKKGGIRIIIKDTGSGIRKEELAQIFDRFFQGSSFQKGSTGIGLAYTKDIIELHDGAITVDSVSEKELKEGQRSGTLFKIDLPYLDAIEDIPENQMVDESVDDLKIGEVNSAKNKKTPFKEKKYTILIVEDDFDMRRYLAVELKKQFKVLTASNGMEGYNIAVKKYPDLIISDFQMPVMDGYEMAVKLKSDIETSHIPVIMLSIRMSNQALHTFFKAGVDDFISKPFSMSLLLSRVENIIATRRILKDRFKNSQSILPSEIATSSNDEKFLQSAFDIVKENLSNPDFSGEEFVKKMQMSTGTVYNKLKNLTGQTVSEFVNTIRLKHASLLLVKTQKNISEVAYESGFNSITYFNRSFKSMYQMTPGLYREKAKKSLIIRNV